MDSGINYTTIEELHHALVFRQHTPREIWDYFRECIQNKNATKLKGSETEYHNLSVEFSKQDATAFAAGTAKHASTIYPFSWTILADIIKYSQENGDIDDCEKAFQKLIKIDRKYWDWRPFVFSIDYLKDSFSSISRRSDVTAKTSDEVIKIHEKNIAQAEELIQEYKKFLPYDERSYIAEAEIFLQQADDASAMQSLETGISTIPVCPQCCMKLADMYLQRGMYEKTVETANSGILSSLQEQPTVSTAYLYYVKALAQDALRLQARKNNTNFDPDKLKDIIVSYRTADSLFINENRPGVAYRQTIAARLIILQMEEYGTIKDEELTN